MPAPPPEITAQSMTKEKFKFIICDVNHTRGVSMTLENRVCHYLKRWKSEAHTEINYCY
jgi:hypothetical protein